MFEKKVIQKRATLFHLNHSFEPPRTTYEILDIQVRQVHKFYLNALLGHYPRRWYRWRGSIREAAE
jgi:hypothetical protein